MGNNTWGKWAGALALVSVAAVSGCSSSDGADAKPDAAKVEAVSLSEATTAFQGAVTKFDADGGCLEQEPGTCWEQMQALMEPARTLRGAANAEKGAGPEFWSEAYALIDTMEDGIAVGEDQGVPPGGVTNRPDVLGSAHALSDWLDEHPVK